MVRAAADWPDWKQRTRLLMIKVVEAEDHEQGSRSRAVFPDTHPRAPLRRRRAALPTCGPARTAHPGRGPGPSAGPAPRPGGAATASASCSPCAQSPCSAARPRRPASPASPPTAVLTCAGVSGSRRPPRSPPPWADCCTASTAMPSTTPWAPGGVCSAAHRAPGRPAPPALRRPRRAATDRRTSVSPAAARRPPAHWPRPRTARRPAGAAPRVARAPGRSSLRCLLFVACTRARDGLYVSWTGQPSPFLVEAGCGVG